MPTFMLAMPRAGNGFPSSPRLIKGGIVLLHPVRGVVLQIIVLQYNPDTLNRTLQVQGAGAETGDRLEALRLKGPPIETIRLEAEIDAADQLELPEQNPVAVQHGIYPQLAALELVVYPTSRRLQANDLLASLSTLEIVPAESPLTLFVWSKNRVMPVRLVELTIAEEAFDPDLNPIRAKVTLALRVLSVNDLGFDRRASSLYLAYQRQKEALASLYQGGQLNDLGIQSLP